MVATIHEHALSRKGKQSYISPSITTKFIVMGTGSAVDGDGNPVDEVQEVIDLVEDENNVPKTYGALILQDYSYEPQGGGIWSVNVDYERSKDRYEISFDTTGGRTKKFTAIETESYNLILPGDTVPNNENLIGEQDDKVEGVDIGIAKLTFTISLSLRFSVMEAGYLKKLYDYTYTTNDDQVSLYWQDQELIFDAEELLFEGATAKQTSDDEMAITYKFEASRSETDISIGNNDNINKPGWRYLDIKTSHQREAGPPPRRCIRPEFARVHKVYRTKDFSQLMLFNGG